jgi:hypothetical protein
MMQAGSTQAEADRLASGVAMQVYENVTGETQARSRAEGVTKQEAAQRELRDEAASARSKAPRPTASFSNASDLYHSLQLAVSSKGDKIQEEILMENRRAADRLEKIYEATVANKPPRDRPAVAMGPA